MSSCIDHVHGDTFEILLNHEVRKLKPYVLLVFMVSPVCDPVTYTPLYCFSVGTNNDKRLRQFADEKTKK